MAKLYGIGVGPGDSELMTLKSVRIINECDVILLPKSGQAINVAYTIAKGAVPNIDDKEIMELDMPMVHGKEKWKESHDLAAKKVIDLLEKGKNVAFLTLGDPTIYSTYAYVHNRVKKTHETEIIPGIPSFCAVAARLNDSLTEAEEELHIIPGSYTGVEDSLDLKGTKVLMKTGKSIGKIKEHIKEMNKQCRVKMIERCGMEGERVFNSIDEIDDKAGYLSVMIIQDRENDSEEDKKCK